MAKDLVFEIGTEEMPSAAVYSGIKQLGESARKLLEENRLSCEEIRTMGTPRRLVLLVSSLSEKQDDLVKEVKGPAKKAAYSDDGKPAAAAIGFARGQGVDVDALVVKQVAQGEYVYAIKKEKGLPAAKVLPKILEQVASSITFSKAMRWDESDTQFVRPVRWLLALFGDTKIKFDFAGLKSDNLTWGHRFLVKNPIKVESSNKYLPAMKKGKVLVDETERAGYIEKQAQKVAKKVGGNVVIHSGTFDEVVQLVEFPHVISGSFSKEYVKLPRDVLITSMESHQRYFPVENNKGVLLPFFIVVHNGDPKSNDMICRGHERVLRARLADAKFFFEEDQKKPLKDKVEKLKGVIFQEKLGTVFDKTKRIEKLAVSIAKGLQCKEDVLKNVKRAAYLCKADLVTEMVVEFPTLQGVMGREYALLSGEKKAAAQAIFEHYLPRYTGDVLPDTLEGKILSMADKVDSIGGCFSIGFLPTGSEDPYALRRQGQGILSIILENGFAFSLIDVLEDSLKLYEKANLKLRPKQEVIRDLEEFFQRRLRGQFINEGFKYDVVDAVLALGISNPADLRDRINAVSSLRDTSEMENVIIAFTRCSNLAKLDLGDNVKKNLLKEEEEKELFEVVEKVGNLVKKDIEKRDYEQAIRNLALLRPDVDLFFDEILVMAKEKATRENRLTLLNKCVDCYLQVADFSKLVVPGNQNN